MTLHELVVLSIACAAGACAFADEPAAPSTHARLAGCPILICGENAATAGDGLLFDELDLFGRPNYAGVALIGANLGASLGGAQVKLDIWGDELVASDPTSGTSYRDLLLIGAEIHFVYTSTGEPFDIRIDDVSKVTYLSGMRDPVPVYLMRARRKGSSKFDFEICNHESLMIDPTWTRTELAHYALLYRGDRYVPDAKKLMPNDPWDGWSFLACNGSAASKLHLWRHTYAGGFDSAGNPTYMTSLDERTALLKAITADYCGWGWPDFTVTGTPLAFATAKEPGAFPFPYTVPMRSLEALWGADGAHCLDVPRREAFGVTHAIVEAKCGRTFAPCAPPGARSPPAGWYLTHHAVTANP